MTDTTEASTIAAIAQQAAKPNELDPGAIYAVPSDDGSWDETSDSIRADYRSNARAALAATRKAGLL